MNPFRKNEKNLALNTFRGHPTKGATAPQSLMETYLQFIIYEKLLSSS